MLVQFRFKIIKKALRIFAWTICLLIFLIGTLFVAIQTDGFQTWLAQRLTAFISSETNSNITIGRVSLRFFTSAVLKDVYVEAPGKDTLFYFKEVGVHVDELSSDTKKLVIGKVTLNEGFFNLVHQNGAAHDNLYFLTEYFASSDTTDTTSSPWSIAVKEVELDNFRFKYHDYNDAPERFGVDFSHLEVSEAFGDVHDVHFINDSIFAKLDHLRFKEKSGFVVNDFSGDAKVSDTEIRIQSLDAHTPASSLQGDLVMQYNAWEDFDDFITKVKWKGDLQPCTIASKDFAYFASDLEGLNRTVQVQGTFKGTVSKFRGKNAILKWGNRSLFKGNFMVTGLPETDDTYLDILAEEIQTNVQDVEAIPLPPFTEGKTIALPENLNCLGDIKFQGKFTGFFSDFVAYGNISTAIGYISSDINLKYEPNIQSYSYDGHLNTNLFDVGKLTETPGLGVISMDAEVAGKGFQIKDINAKLEGKVGLIVYNGYTYRNVKVEGKIAKKLFNGSVEMHEEDVDFVFDGGINMREKLPVFDFNAKVNRLRIDLLNFFKLDEPYALSTNITSRLVGNNLDNLSGTVDIENSFLQVEKKVYHLNQLQLIADKTDAGIRTMSLSSDILNADITGKFELASLPATFREIIPRYLPNVLLPVKGASTQQDFTFNVDLKNTSIVTDNFLKGLYFDPATRLYGSVNSAKKTFDIRFDSPDIQLESTGWKKLNCKLGAAGDSMTVSLSADTLYYSKAGFIPDLHFNGNAWNNRMDFLLRLADVDSSLNRLRWQGALAFNSITDIELMIDSSTVVLDGLSWNMMSRNNVHYDSLGVHFMNFGIQQNQETISLNGTIGKSATDIVDVAFQKFKLSHLNPSLRGAGLTLNGIMDGTAAISEVYQDVQLRTKLEIDQLLVN